VALTYLIGIGVVYLTAQALIILAYRYASAVILSPLIYSVIPVSVLINWIVWDRPPTLLEFAGIVFVVAGGVFALTGGQQDADELT
jgi:drug/metabolite transporter (DMT)-like permease